MASTKYKNEYAEQAYRLCILGYTDDDLAKYFEVVEKTINNWKEQFPDFLQSLKRGKEEADCDIAFSLYNRAKGMSYIEQVAFKCKETIYGGDGKRLKDIEVIKVAEVTKHVPPDPVSMIYWLKNRQRGRWKDKYPEDEEALKPTGALSDAQFLTLLNAARGSMNAQSDSGE